MTYIDHLYHSIFWYFGWRIVFFAVLTWALFKVFGRLGTSAKAQDSGSRWMSAKPAIGGFVFLAGFALAFYQAVFIQHELKYGKVWLVTSVFAAFLLGLADDIYRISAAKKFAGQFLVAILLFISGHVVIYNGMDDNSGSIPFILEAILIIFIIVASMNSVNMLDNMDGIATIAVLPVLMIAGVCMVSNDGMVGFYMIPTLLGFLVLNWTPAKVYMGDSGSMLLGVVAAWMILSLGNTTEYPGYPRNLQTTAVVFLGSGAIFICDTLVVIIQRLRHRVSPFKGGRDHTTHNLFYLGLKQWQIACLFILLALIQTWLVLRFIHILKRQHSENFLLLCSPILAYFFLLLLTHLMISFRNLRKGKYSYSK